MLLILLAPFAGLFIWLNYEKAKTRQEVKHALIAGIDREELVLLSFTIEEASRLLDWEHETEFEYNDHMYDVVETEIKDGMVYYWCWPDREETELNRQIERLLARASTEDNRKNENPTRIIQVLKNLFPAGAELTEPSYFFIAESLIQYKNKHWDSLSLPPPYPPPKSV